MTRSDPVDREGVNRLMMASLDGEISGDEQRELDAILEAHPEIRKEYQMMSRVKEVTGAMTYDSPPEEVWDRYWTSVYNKFERGVGWILISIGTAVLLAYGSWRWLETVWGDTGLPLFIRIAILSVAAGLFVLTISVIREKLFTRKHDPYKEIER